MCKIVQELCLSPIFIFVTNILTVLLAGITSSRRWSSWVWYWSIHLDRAHLQLATVVKVTQPVSELLLSALASSYRCSRCAIGTVTGFCVFAWIYVLYSIIVYMLESPLTSSNSRLLFVVLQQQQAVRQQVLEQVLACVLTRSTACVTHYLGMANDYTSILSSNKIYLYINLIR